MLWAGFKELVLNIRNIFVSFLYSIELAKLLNESKLLLGFLWSLCDKIYKVTKIISEHLLFTGGAKLGVAESSGSV